MPNKKEKNGYLSGSFVMLVGAVVLLSRVSCARRREDNGSRGSFRRYRDAGADFYRQLGGPRNRSNPSLPKCAIGSLDRKIIGGKRFSDASFDLHETLGEVKKTTGINLVRSGAQDRKCVLRPVLFLPGFLSRFHFLIDSASVSFLIFLS